MANLVQQAIGSITKGFIDFLKEAGYGYDIRARKISVDPYSDDGSAVWLSWNSKLKNGAKDVE